MTRRTPRCLAVATAMLVGLVPAAGAQDRAATPRTSIGIYYQPGAAGETRLWREGDAGDPLTLRGEVRDSSGRALEDAEVELWQADARGMVHPQRYRTRLRADARGRFQVLTVKPAYIPGAAGVWGARHIHIVVSHPLHERLVSLIFFHDDPRRPGGEYDTLAIFVEQASVEGRTVHFGEVRVTLP